MEIKYFEKPHGIEYLIIEGYELKVTNLLSFFKYAKSEESLTKKDMPEFEKKAKELLGEAWSRLKNFDFPEFEYQVMKVLKDIWDYDNDQMCTGSD